MSDRSLPKLQIDADTVFQVEVNSARNEVVARLGFERTLLTLQIQVLAGTLAAFATITQGKFQLTPYYIEIACAIVLWISFALAGGPIMGAPFMTASSS